MFTKLLYPLVTSAAINNHAELFRALGRVCEMHLVQTNYLCTITCLFIPLGHLKSCLISDQLMKIHDKATLL